MMTTRTAVDTKAARSAARNWSVNHKGRARGERSAVAWVNDMADELDAARAQCKALEEALPDEDGLDNEAINLLEQDRIWGGGNIVLRTAAAWLVRWSGRVRAVKGIDPPRSWLVYARILGVDPATGRQGDPTIWREKLDALDSPPPA